MPIKWKLNKTKYRINMKYELEMNMAVMAEVSTNQSKYFILRQNTVYGLKFCNIWGETKTTSS